MEPRERIKQVRKMLRLSQEEFADRIHVDRSYLSQIENGKVGLIDRWIHQISLEFGVSEKWIQSGIGEVFISSESLIPRDAAIEYLVSIVRGLPEAQQNEILCFIKGLAERFNLGEKKDSERENFG